MSDSGSKSWIVRTTINGKRSWVGAGSLSYTSLSEARDKAIDIRRAARNGGDPLAEKRQQKLEAQHKRKEEGRPTFEVAARQVHAEHSKAFRNPKHAAQWISSLESYVFPTIGPKRVDVIESSDMLRVLSPIWMEKRETADRVKQRMRVVFDWAIASGYRTAVNPVEGITKVLPKHNIEDKHFAALPYPQVPTFIGLLRSDAGVSGRLAFEFLILTAARTNEVIKAKWNEIDREAKIWTRPAEHMKFKRPHAVPLSARCIEILEAAKNISDGSDYIFPGMRTGKPLSNMVFLATLQRMDKTEITPHGFRSSFRDWAEEKTNYKDFVVEMALAHTIDDKVIKAYKRTDVLELRRELMNDWARFATRAAAAKVVSMRG